MGEEGLSVEGIDADFTPQRRSSVASVEIDGEAVLYDEDTGSLHLLNPTAALLWQAFDGSTTLGGLSDELSEAFATDRDVIYGDVLEATRQMGKLGVLEGIAVETSAEAETLRAGDGTEEGRTGV